MIRRFSALAEGTVLEADVCVMGAGPAGGSIAARLAQAGIRVVVVDGGPDGYQTSEEYGNVFEVDGIPYPAAESRVFGLGGSANAWHIMEHRGPARVRLRPLEPHQFTARPWIPNSGWPLSRDDLVPFYETALRKFGESMEVLEPHSDVLDVSSTDFDVGVMFLGARSAIVDSQRDGLASSTEVTIVTEAVVSRMELKPSSTEISRVFVVDLSGREVAVEASVFVLALGGIENARALLMLAGPEGRGPGNRYGLVGRFFMEHPHRIAGFVKSTDPFFARFDQKSDDVWEHKREHWFLSSPELSERLGTCALGIGIRSLKPEQYARGRWAYGPADTPGALGSAWRDALESGTAPGYRHAAPAFFRDPARTLYAGSRRAIGDFSALLAQRRDKGNTGHFALNIMAEQVPVPANRVVLSSRRDKWGFPLARLEWAIDDLTLSSVRANTRRFFDQLEKKLGVDIHAPAARYRTGYGFGWGYHHMGTTRMDDEPARGVVDSDGRVHDLENLYVAGSSVFPTSGVSNPTLTILALALRLAEHLVGRLSN